MFSFRSRKPESVPLLAVSIDDLTNKASLLIDRELHNTVRELIYLQTESNGDSVLAHEAADRIRAFLAVHGYEIATPDIPKHLESASADWTSKDKQMFAVVSFATRFLKVIDELEGDDKLSVVA